MLDPIFCKIETLKILISLYSHALLILAKSSHPNAYPSVLDPIFCKIETLKILISLHSHALLILAKSSQVPLIPKVTDAQIKVKLMIPQLTLGVLAQMNRHWDETAKVLV